MTNKMELCRIISYSLAVLHVSSALFAHHQERLNCITASGMTHVCRCQPAATYVCNTRYDLSRRAACGRAPAEILGSIPTGGMDICLLCVSCVVR